MTETAGSLRESAAWADVLVAAAEIIWPLDCRSIGPSEAAVVAASAMRVRVSRLLRACSLLCAAGYANEIAGLVRSVFEDAVSAAYIAESPDDRARRWLDYSEARRVHHLRQAVNHPEWVTDPSALTSVEQAIEGLDASSDNYWAGKGSSALALELLNSDDPYRALLGRDFGIYYQTLCDDTHGSPFAVGLLLSPGDEAAQVDTGPSPLRSDELPPLLLYGASQFAHAVEALGAEIDADGLKRMVEDAQVKLETSWAASM